MGFLNDWAWKPGVIELAALKRGEAKEKERRRAARDDLFNFNLSRAARKKTKKGLRLEEQAQVDIFLYQHRISGSGLMKGKPVSGEWATLLYFMMGASKPLGRYRSFDEAKKAIAKFKGKVQYDSFYIVTADEDIRHFDNAVCDSLFQAFGDTRYGLKKEMKQDMVRWYCSVFDKSRHGADGSLSKPYKPAPTTGLKMKTETVEGSTTPDEATETTEVATKKASKKKSTGGKVAKKKAAAPAKAKGKAAAKGKSKGKGAIAPTPSAKKSGGATPRAEGKAAIIKAALNAGKNVEQVIDIVQDKCTDTDKVNRSYVMWYYHSMAKKGELTPAAKKTYESSKKKD